MDACGRLRTVANGCGRTVANGCERLRSVEQTHPQPPDPQSETVTFATHSGKSCWANPLPHHSPHFLGMAWTVWNNISIVCWLYSLAIKRGLAGKSPDDMFYVLIFSIKTQGGFLLRCLTTQRYIHQFSINSPFYCIHTPIIISLISH